MNELTFILGFPLFATLLLIFIKNYAISSRLNIVFSGLSFIASVFLAVNVLNSSEPLFFFNKMFYLDAFNVYLTVLTAFVGTTTAIFSRPYMAHELKIGRINTTRIRMYHAMYQFFLFAMLLALTTNNLGLLWVAMESATLATVLLVSLYRTPASIEAAWKYFILCGVGIAQALFGTVLLYFAAFHVVPDVSQALLWSELNLHAGQFNPVITGLAFVFLLIGYGTKMGLAPLHNWLPDAHSEGPTPVSAVLSGLLLNVALYALIRVKIIVDDSLSNDIAGYLLMFFGLISFIMAAFFLHGRRDIKRMFSYSSIEHMGLITFAFGIGTPLAVFAGLLHMTVHSLTKSAIFITVGHACQIAKTQSMDQIRGLIRTQPTVGWGLLMGTAAIAGFPPFGVFTSEFLLLSATIKSWPWLAPVLLIGLVIAFAGLFKHIQPMVFGEAPAGQVAVKANMLPVILQLLLVLWLGLAIPDFLSNWFNQVTLLITGSGLL